MSLHSSNKNNADDLWALVTGSTAGIGRAFCDHFAAAGFNLVLLSRSEADLKQLAQELAKQWGIKTRYLACDLADPELLLNIDAATNDLEISFLVSNAGFPSYHGRFFERALRDFEESLRVNTLVQAQLIRYFGERMKTRAKGAIIQVSSITGHITMPFMAEYTASKAFQLSLGEALYYEFKDYGIDFLVLSPGATKSRRIKFGMEASAVVAEAFDVLGRQPSVLPGWRNRWSAFKNRHLRSRRRAIAKMGEFQRGQLQVRDPQNLD